MEKTTPTALFLSLFILATSTAGGALLVRKVGGGAAGHQAFLIGSMIAGSVFLLQIAMYLLERDRLVYAVLFRAAFGLSLTWFMLCLFMPILWIAAVPMWAKHAALLLLSGLCLTNLVKGFRQFAINWAALRDPLRVGKVNLAKRAIAWEAIQQSLRHESDIYIPWLPQRLITILSVLLVLSMLLGLSLRKAHPLFGSFAWGVPCAVFSAYFFQLIGYGLAEAGKIRAIESELKVVFKCTA